MWFLKRIIFSIGNSPDQWGRGKRKFPKEAQLTTTSVKETIQRKKNKSAFLDMVR